MVNVLGDAHCVLISLLEIKWTEEYPSELPALSLESFYNKHLVPEVKTHILKAVTGQESFVTFLAKIFS